MVKSTPCGTNDSVNDGDNKQRDAAQQQSVTELDEDIRMVTRRRDFGIDISQMMRIGDLARAIQKMIKTILMIQYVPRVRGLSHSGHIKAQVELHCSVKALGGVNENCRKIQKGDGSSI